MNVSFTVRGVPVPQGSKRALVHRSTGRAVVIEQGGQRHKDWRADVKAAAAEAMELSQGQPFELLTGPVGVSICFTMPKPKSAPKTRRTWPDKRPDLDKLVRTILDAITGEVIADDAQVIGAIPTEAFPGESDLFGRMGMDVPGAAVEVWQVEFGTIGPWQPWHVTRNED
jgi:Holliday junction resolvase RusA-like endonuclease